MEVKDHVTPVYELHRVFTLTDVVWPRVEVRENDRDFEVRAELPGLEPADVDVRFANGVLILKGCGDRWAGNFERQIPIGDAVDAERIYPTLRHGILAVTLVKKAEAQRRAPRFTLN
jgi:HSP20 family protein